MIGRFFTRLAISIAALLIALLAAVTAIAFFTYALYLVLLNIVVPPAAAALTGVLILLLSILLAFAARSITRPKRRPVHETNPSLDATAIAAELGGELARKMRGFTDTHKSGSLLAALLAGFAFGASPKLRGLLRDILKL